MIADFVVMALLGAGVVGVIAGPLGCVMVWRRMSFFGEALAHSALLGVALAYLLKLNLTVGIAVFSFLIATLLAMLQNQRVIANDTLLGLMAHSGLALGLIVIVAIEGLRFDLTGFLFGDVLAIGRFDLMMMAGYAVFALGILWRIWPSLVSVVINEDLAIVDGVAAARIKWIYIYLLAGAVAVGMRVVGLLLIVSLLIIPAAAARRHTRTPEQMAVLSSVLAVLAVLLGMAASLTWDIPAGPAMVLAATGFFLVGLLAPQKI